MLDALELCDVISGEVEEAGLRGSRLSVGGEGAEIAEGGIGLINCCYSFAFGIIQ